MLVRGGGDADATVFDTEEDGLATEILTVEDPLGDGKDGDIDVLQGRGQDVVRSQGILVEVDADRPLVELLGRFDDA